MMCAACDGRGSIAVEHGSSPRYRCPDCGGSGRVVEEVEDEGEPEPEIEDDQHRDVGAELWRVMTQ